MLLQRAAEGSRGLRRGARKGSGRRKELRRSVRESGWRGAAMVVVGEDGRGRNLSIA